MIKQMEALAGPYVLDPNQWTGKVFCNRIQSTEPQIILETPLLLDYQSRPSWKERTQENQVGIIQPESEDVYEREVLEGLCEAVLRRGVKVKTGLLGQCYEERDVPDMLQ